MPTKTQVDEGVERGIGMGYGVYDDSTYTSASPLVIANTSTQITIDGLGSSTYTDQLPEGVTEFWDSVTNRIVTDTVGDAFDLRLGFKAKSSATNSFFDITFDIGDPSGIVVAGQSKVMPKGLNTETRLTVDIPIFALSTFVANGCAIWFNTNVSGITLSVYDITLMVKRDYTNPV
jgi:hypothetical protein